MVELDLAYKEHLYKQEDERKTSQEKLYYYYNGDEDELLKYLDEALGKTFDEKSIEEFQKDYLNITQKLIKETSAVYTEPAIRTLSEGETEKEELTKYFNEVLTDRLNSKDKKIHRFGKLFNTALMEVFYNKITGKIDFKIINPAKLTVIPHDDDDFRIGMLLYDKYYKNGKDKDELYTVVVTDKDLFKFDANGNKVPFKENPKMINPFGLVNFAIMRMEEMEDFWGVGQHNIVNTNELVNVLLTDLLNQTILGAWGTPLFVNCGLDKKASDDDGDGVKRLAVGPKHPVSVDNVNTDMVAPRIEYVSHNAEIDKVKALISWRIETLAANYGLDPNTFAHEIKATSGFSKVMDRINQIEIREDDLEPCREFEQDRFRVIKAVNNYYASLKDNKLKEIPDNTELRVDFAEIGIPKTEDEKWKDREEQEKRFMGNAVDWLMEDNPDLKKEEAEQILKDNKALADELAVKPMTQFENLFNEPEETVEDDNT